MKNQKDNCIVSVFKETVDVFGKRKKRWIEVSAMISKEFADELARGYEAHGYDTRIETKGSEK